MGRQLTYGIDVTRTEQLIKDLGVRVKIYKSTLCPNMKSLETTDHDIDCPYCNNNMVDFDCHESMALFQQQDLQETFRLTGTFHIDELIATFPIGETIQVYTKIELLDFAEDFYELIQRQVGVDTDNLSYNACTVLGVFAIVGGTLIRYYLDADFVIDSNGNIKWISTHKPADKTVYSIYYKHKPVYRTVKAIHRDRYSQFNLRSADNEEIVNKKTVDGKTYIKMQECWILKRDYLLERRDGSGNKIRQNVYYNPNE